MKKQYDLPEVVDKDESEIRDIIAQIKASALPDEVKHFVIKCIELALWLPTFLQNKAISMHRLRTIIFGKGYNNKKNTKLTEPVKPEETIDLAQSSTTDTLSVTLKTLELTSDATGNTSLTLSPTSSTNIIEGSLSNALEPKDKKPGHGASCKIAKTLTV